MCAPYAFIQPMCHKTKTMLTHTSANQVQSDKTASTRLFLADHVRGSCDLSIKQDQLHNASVGFCVEGWVCLFCGKVSKTTCLYTGLTKTRRINMQNAHWDNHNLSVGICQLTETCECCEQAHYNIKLCFVHTSRSLIFTKKKYYV